MRFKMMALVAAAAIALPATAQTDTSAPTAKPKKEKKICRSEPAMTGSNMARSICKTKSEWAVSDGTGDGQTSSNGVRSSTDAGNLGPGVR
jgi:hypothetical protein